MSPVVGQEAASIARPAAPPLSPGHGASLATTAGITSVITMVMAASLLGQCGNLSGSAQGLAAGTLGAMVIGAGLLYSAREAIGAAMDLAPGDPALSRAMGRRGLTLYHFGKAALFAGLAFGVAWRLAVPFGALGWLGVLAAAGFAGAATLKAVRYLGDRST